MDQPLTPEQIAEIRAREQAATPGPWADLEDMVTSPDHTSVINHEWGVGTDGYPGMKQEDVDFIVASRQDIPALLATVEALTKRNEGLERQLALVRRLRKEQENV